MSIHLLSLRTFLLPPPPLPLSFVFFFFFLPYFFPRPSAEGPIREFVTSNSFSRAFLFSFSGFRLSPSSRRQSERASEYARARAQTFTLMYEVNRKSSMCTYVPAVSAAGIFSFGGSSKKGRDMPRRRVPDLMHSA